MTTDKKALSQERFSQFAERYVSSVHHAKGADLDRLVALAQPQDDWQALDIATGGGHTALKFAPFVAHVIASDITPNMLEKAESFIRSQNVENVSYQIADAESLPFEDTFFNLVTCRIAPHHFPDVQAFVNEAYRVLKPGGLFLLQDQLLPDERSIADVIEQFESTRDPSHNQAFSLPEWSQKFSVAGFSIEHTEEVTKRQQFIKWAKVQDNTDETIQYLSTLVTNAEPGVREWMQPEEWGTEKATFVHHHIIIAGRK